jgi:HEAT repeat protein
LNTDDDARVRAQAALALGRLGAVSASALRALSARLGDEASEVRALAARALGFVGAPARVAVPALNAAARDEDARVRREASKALRRIQSGGPLSSERDAEDTLAGARAPAQSRAPQ